MKLRTMSRADQNRSSFTEADSSALSVFFDSRGLIAASCAFRISISPISRSEWPRAAAVSPSRVSARHTVPVVSAKLVALRRSREKMTKLALKASTSWRYEFTRLSANMTAAEARAKTSNPEI
ncbi:hypothetical protein [Mesorhizobium sp. M1A.F.Ca.IN.020.32.1.1]|uniref:hypothetical protein n=1 Tax=Mesorhizobium sp. M1A.F.Ca.IN.020.32.1.1 TaxID=2496763 RepID=UPI001FE00587|nr:hypothetical protein [Mesorhizobium sp. M1A.F.Ca.IN.020.32.1.1]